MKVLLIEIIFILKDYSNKLKENTKEKSIKPQEEQPGIIERGIDTIQDLFGETPQVQQETQVSNIQTPPLPNTPMPNVQMTQAKDPRTNLTRTESALLSPSEQLIASRT